MKQTEIYMLLREAAQHACDEDRANAIYVALLREVYGWQDPTQSELEDAKSEAMCNVLNSVFIATFLNNRAALPALFPFFATLCGDREEGTTMTDPDWSLMRLMQEVEA